MELLLMIVFLIVYVALFLYLVQVPLSQSREIVLKSIDSPISGTISLVKKGKKEVWLRMFGVTQGIDARTFTNKKSYWHKVAEIILEKVKDKKHAEVLYFGLGGGTIPYLVGQNHEGVAQTVVEIDPVLVKIVREDFGLEHQESIRIVEADAYRLASEGYDFEQYFDVVMVDIFADEDSLASPASTDVSFITYVRTLLKKEGMLVFNHPAHTPKAVEGASRLVQNLESQGWVVKQYKVFDSKRFFRNVVVKVEF
jgi:spermidine synthase